MSGGVSLFFCALLEVNTAVSQRYNYTEHILAGSLCGSMAVTCMAEAGVSSEAYICQTSLF